MRASACPSSCTSTSSLSAPISNATSLTRPESLSPLLSGAVSPRSGLVSRLSLSCTVGCTGASYTLLDTFLPPVFTPFLSSHLVLAVLPSDGVRVLLGQPQLLHLLQQGSLVQVVLGVVGPWMYSKDLLDQ